MPITDTNTEVNKIKCTQDVKDRLYSSVVLAFIIYLSVFIYGIFVFITIIFFIIGILETRKIKNKIKITNAENLESKSVKKLNRLLGILDISLITYLITMIFIYSSFPSRSGIIWILFVVHGNDVISYLAGNLAPIEKRIFPFPNISPKKTVQGYLGGLIGAMILNTILFFLLSKNHIFSNYITSVVDTLIIVIVANAGDLYVSYLKRAVDIKDSGNLIPGHGGMLDRLDSFIFAAPILCILMMSGFFFLISYHFS